MAEELRDEVAKEGASKAAAEVIAAGEASLGIELGSTRIKACLVDEQGEVLATGVHSWESTQVDGHWSYTLDDVWAGLRAAYADLRENVRAVTGGGIAKLRALGVSAMMHGYLAFDAAGEQLVPFRTWRDTHTGRAAGELTELFGENIPLRWSVAHHYQAVLDGEPGDVAFLTTLAGYVHWKLSGRKVLGIGDAAGMFPIDIAAGDYDERCLCLYGERIGREVRPLLPEVLRAGQVAGELITPQLLDASGELQAGAPMCPPEGDAGTGMVATNAVREATGSVSVGTSIFAMIVTEDKPSKPYPEIDVVTTPAGRPVAMVHCNNGAQEISDWTSLFAEVAVAFGKARIENMDDVYTAILTEALRGEPDCGGVVVYNYRAGEPVAGLVEGRPLVVRTVDARFTLPNLMRAHLYSVFATLAMGMRTLRAEGVHVDVIQAHGGIFRTVGVAQRFLAAALKAPVGVAESAGEGGAWGMALLARYLGEQSSLEDFLDRVVFGGNVAAKVKEPELADAAGFQAYLHRYESALELEETAVRVLPAVHRDKSSETEG